MYYYVLVINDVITLFSHTKNKSCEHIKAEVKELSDKGFRGSLFKLVLDRMVEEGFKLESNVETINIMDNEQNQRGD